ncbi:hypothetical protein [Rossellomorea vietnamensis]|uniref:hypothetical protein n=1 Tax=Rossellomorea vietnamensis TaxID=218284 RepID=UPI001E5EEE90|nr:hypothetical protein [Rossellomorea vietnamensis]MCC5801913.1 hypothetical protein [Rossellomorea vietnamensis]
MFGAILKELSRGLNFKYKQEFIAKCNELNALRIKVVHKITKYPLEELQEEAQNVKDIFENIMALFNIGRNHLLFWINDVVSSVDWEDVYEDIAT